MLMKKRALTLVLSIITCLTGCKKADQSDREIDDAPLDPGIHSVDEINDSNINSFAAAFLYKLKSYSSYKAVTEGTTHVTGFLTDVTQTISATAIKGEYSFLTNESRSKIVKTAHSAYFKDDKVVYNDNKGKYQSSSLKDYLIRYGSYPFDNSIEGYLIKEGVTVTKETSDADYKFKLMFDKEICTTNVKIEMRQFGGLDQDPSFIEDIEMLITVKQDLTPITLEFSSHYSAQKIISTDCHQKYTVTYSNFNETIEIPNLEEIISYFG